MLPFSWLNTIVFPAAALTVLLRCVLDVSPFWLDWLGPCGDWRILGLWVWLVACSNPFVVWHSVCGPLGYAATCARRGPSILIAQAGPQRAST